MGPNRSELCHLLRHKYLMAVGDTSSMYLMHDLLLDWTRERAQTCYGDLYCTVHAICLDKLRTGTDVNRSWDSDERIFNRLPDPPKTSPFSAVDARPTKAD
jgi:hypothetical protein